MKRPARPSKSRNRLSRRGFMQTSAVAGSQLMWLPGASRAAGNSLEGYASAPSVVPGGTLDFFLRDPQAVGAATSVYPLSFTRISAPDVAMLATTVAVGNQVVPADASTRGCRWQRSFRLTVPAHWPSGLYFAFVGSDENACTVPFVVRAASATAGVKTLVMVPVSTVHAYNAYGGKSIYDFNSSGGVRASQVSFDRPFTEAFNSFFDSYSQHLVRWLAKNKLAADFCTDLDIEANPGLLQPYQLYVQAGHDEYWTAARRNTMDAFVANGGNAAYLGGNTMWFQARLQANSAGVPRRTLVCYKDAAADPVADPALKTVPWINLATPRPENSSIGTGFVTGCSWTGAQPRPNTPSVVMRPEHWAFAGTGLAQGAGFGGAYVGYESNSAQFAWGADQRPYPTGADGTPGTLRILAQADGSNWNELSLAAGGAGEQSGHAHIAVFSRGGRAGTVFSSGSTDWAYGLIPELDGLPATPISRITRNVINKLSAVWAETADVRQFHKVVAGALWNTYYGVGPSAPAGSGMTLDGLAFRAYAAAVSGSVPVYRFRSATPGSTGTRYRYSLGTSLGATDTQWVLDGVAFHAHATAGANTVPVYEHAILNDALKEFSALYSTSPTPPAGWLAGPVRFYAPNDGATAAAPGFSLTVSSTGVLALKPGQSILSDMIQVVPVNGFSQSVSFSLEGLPAGISATFQPGTSKGGTKLALTAGAGAPAGTYMLKVTGTAPASAAGPAATASITLQLQVSVAPVPGFTLSPPNNDMKLQPGQSDTSNSIKITPLNGFNETVWFTVSGLPLGTLPYFDPVASKSATRLNILSTLLTPKGTYQLTITGVSLSPNVSARTVVTLVVR